MTDLFYLIPSMYLLSEAGCPQYEVHFLINLYIFKVIHYSRVFAEPPTPLPNVADLKTNIFFTESL